MNCFDSNLKTWLVITSDHKLKLWDTNTGKIIHDFTLPSHLSTTITALAWTNQHESRFINKLGGLGTAVLGTQKGKIILFNLSSQEIITEIQDETTSNFGKINDIKLSQDSAYIYSSYEAGFVCIWNFPNSSIIQVLDKYAGHQNAIQFIQFFPNEKYFITLAGELYANLWETNKSSNPNPLISDSPTKTAEFYHIPKKNETRILLIADQACYLYNYNENQNLNMNDKQKIMDQKYKIKITRNQKEGKIIACKFLTSKKILLVHGTPDNPFFETIIFYSHKKGGFFDSIIPIRTLTLTEKKKEVGEDPMEIEKEMKQRENETHLLLSQNVAFSIPQSKFQQDQLIFQKEDFYETFTYPKATEKQIKSLGQKIENDFMELEKKNLQIQTPKIIKKSKLISIIKKNISENQTIIAINHLLYLKNQQKILNIIQEIPTDCVVPLILEMISLSKSNTKTFNKLYFWIQNLLIIRTKDALSNKIVNESLIEFNKLCEERTENLRNLFKLNGKISHSLTKRK
ncbi:wd repeat-containing protein [Anaeramoeba ignava]|uniref:Wd repeat-containing protein n=1 Tax=Anaeramoeba ignava TaxID=1746090 RepID=A0A9Q0LNZ5_ANAIG|nr:wd repeat-containing protein [Anaeramoeba ignava]